MNKKPTLTRDQKLRAEKALRSVLLQAPKSILWIWDRTISWNHILMEPMIDPDFIEKLTMNLRNRYYHLL